MKIGILGVAHMHVYSYVDALHKLEDVTLVGVYDVDRERAGRAAEHFGAPIADDAEALAKDCDAVIVCSENALHADLVITAARQGCHILCEKPIATSVEDATRMLAACKEAGVYFQTAFPVRYATPVRRAKAMVEEGQIGEILAIKGTNRGSMPGGWFIEPSLSGGGAVLDHTVHVTDLMRWFTGSEVTEVYAEVDRRFHPIGIDDCGILSMRFANGVIATLDPSWSRAKSYPTWGDVTMEIVGTLGVLTVDALAQHSRLYDDEHMRLSWPFFGDDMDREMVRDFVQAIRNDREPSITGVDGQRAMEVALAAYASAKKGDVVALHQANH